MLSIGTRYMSFEDKNVAMQDVNWELTGEKESNWQTMLKRVYAFRATHIEAIPYDCQFIRHLKIKFMKCAWLVSSALIPSKAYTVILPPEFSPTDIWRQTFRWQNVGWYFVERTFRRQSIRRKIVLWQDISETGISPTDCKSTYSSSTNSS